MRVHSTSDAIQLQWRTRQYLGNYTNFILASYRFESIIKNTIVNDLFEILGTMRSIENIIGPSSRILLQSGLTNIQKTVSLNMKALMDVLTL